MGTDLQVDLLRRAALFHALSDPVRLEVLDLLTHGEHCVCELTTALGIAQSRLSFHLKVLKDAELIRDRRGGRWTYYAIAIDAFDEAAATLTGLRPRGEPRTPSQACCD